MSRENGSVIGPVNTPTSSEAKGVWGLPQQYEAQRAGAWPSPPPPIPFTTISRSLRFNAVDVTYLTRTPGSAGSRTTWTFSFWAKQVNNNYTGIKGNGSTIVGTGTDNNNYTQVSFQYAGSFSNVFHWDAYAGTAISGINPNQELRDWGAWAHYVFVYDTTNATEADRMRMYMNGVRLTSFQPFPYTRYPSQNSTTEFNNAVEHRIGMNIPYGATNRYDGYLAQIHFIDGQALTANSFGAFDPITGVWRPITYSGSYGTNGYLLTFSNPASLGADSSGNGNNWTPVNFSTAAGAGNDSLVDTPTSYGEDTGAGGEVRGNYCTINPLTPTSWTTVSNGNLDFTATGNTPKECTMAVSSGKWYYEQVYVSDTHSSAQPLPVGLMRTGSTSWDSSVNPFIWYVYGDNGYIYHNGTGTPYLGSSMSPGDIIMCAFDLDSGKIWFGKNGTWGSSGNPAAGTNPAYSNLSGTLTPVVGGGGSQTVTSTFNFGQRPFAYAAPSGFKALCTQNLPTPTVVQGDDYFNTVLYTGNSSTQAITVGFQPDLLWLKRRDAGNAGRVFDAVRGKDNYLITSSTAAEANFAYLSSFDSNGFTLNSGDSATNTSGGTYVAWNWKANGSGVSNTAGSITSTVSANTTSGFSIVTWTGNGTIGATIGHGLGVVPSMVIFKNRSAVRDWFTYHSAYPTSGSNAYILKLNLTDAVVLDNRANRPWGAFSSSLLTLGSDDETNGSGNSMVAYCFAAVPGFSAFGSYTGNGSTDGPFVYTGFRPAFVMIKQSSASGNNWAIVDDKRDDYNVADLRLFPNTSDAESSSYVVADLLSNGFKVRGALGSTNTSSATYIYMAFAENPFKYSLAR